MTVAKIAEHHQSNLLHGTSAESALFDLQRHQLDHDENFHREIARLSLRDRVTHLVLHFAKYAGRLTGSRRASEDIQKTVIDTFAIALSCANTLNLRAYDLIEDRYGNCSDLRSLASALTVGAGIMADACEKADHMESFDYRGQLSKGLSTILTQLLVFADTHQIDLDHLVRERLLMVKHKSIFFQG